MYSISVDVRAGDLSLSLVFNFLSMHLLTTFLYSKWCLVEATKNYDDEYNNKYDSACK